MRAVITVTGKDTVGILARVSTMCAKYNANVIEVSQTVLQDMFAMIMMVDIDQINCELHELVDIMRTEGERHGLVIQLMHEDLFNSMHRI
ncbi:MULTISPECIES: ACT domain-containing protein [unclassified Paenibacillus]|uniref:ACT domain-containing protein n=1 Tax=unclassified Paenibacillus TaxID=185978 RepID=UPI000837AD64|nr:MULTISPECIES: ACT domain-containing protein [unclassified Paenibacillus]NWL89836.1 ACT domain-containing protein [Paenibacillus sp. 79R4]